MYICARNFSPGHTASLFEQLDPGSPPHFLKTIRTYGTVPGDRRSASYRQAPVVVGVPTIYAQAVLFSYLLRWCEQNRNLPPDTAVCLRPKKRTHHAPTVCQIDLLALSAIDACMRILFCLHPPCAIQGSLRISILVFILLLYFYIHILFWCKSFIATY